MATLINGNGNLAIYAQQDADWYAALMGGQTVITAVGNQFAYELLDANTIGVKDGVIITTEGRRIQLDASAIDSFDIPTGAQGTTNYYIIGYHLVTGDLSEQTCETFVQLMENGTDTIPEGSFRDGDDEVFVSLYRVEQNDLTLGTITLLLPQLSGSFQSQITELNNDLSANNKHFYFDYHDGKYGYNTSAERGADTFSPFSSGIKHLGHFTSNTTIDVSALGATSTSQFLIECDSSKSISGTGSAWYARDNVDLHYPHLSGTFSPASKTLNNGTLSITAPRCSANSYNLIGDSSAYVRGSVSASGYVPYDVYYAPSIES